jgi:hypothetical protein
MTEQEILEENPWRLYGEKPYNYVNANTTVLFDPKAIWLLKEDLPIVKKFNEKVKDKEYKLHLEIPPEPFAGNPLRAKVIILSLNPGYMDRVNRLVAQNLNVDLAKQVNRQKLNQLNLAVDSFICERNIPLKDPRTSYRDADCMIGDWYWYDIFEKFREEAQGKFGVEEDDSAKDKIYGNIAILQYFGYSSSKFKQMPHKALLPSQLFTKSLVEYIAMSKDNVLFVVSRSEALWKNLIGNKIWDMLEKEGRLIHRPIYNGKNGRKVSYRGQQFTANAFENKEIDFNKIVNALLKE